MDIDLSVLIVSYNTIGLTRSCLTSIEEQTHDCSYEVIVVDNASADGSATMIEEEFPWVRLVTCEENLGFAAAVNLAGTRAEGEYLLLLNPDTEVLDSALDRLLRFAKAHPEHGLYGGRTLSPAGVVDPRSCWGRTTLWSLTCFGTVLSAAFRHSSLFNPESLGRWARDSVREVGVVTGCLLLVPAKLWSELGGFDTRFFMYGEDVDLSMRAWRAGWRPVITPEATIMHEVGAASAQRADRLMLVLRGRATVVHQHWQGPARTWGLSMLKLGVGLRALPAVAGWPTAWRAMWTGRRDWIGGYPAAGPNNNAGPLPLRAAGRHV